MPDRRNIILTGLMVMFSLVFLSGLCWPDSVQAATKPDVTTKSATSISTTYATLNGEIESDGNADITEYGFYYGTGSDPASSGSRLKAGTGIDEGEDFYKKLTGLKSGKKYYFTAYAKNSKGIEYGTVKSFTTKDSSDDTPEVTTESASDIGEDYATLNATLNDDGGESITEYGFYYHTGSDPVNDGTKRKVGSRGLYEGDDFSLLINGLNEDKKYYFAAYAKNSNGISYGDVEYFTAGVSGSSSKKPTVTTYAADNVSDTEATLNGEIDSKGSSSITEYGFYYGTTSSCSSKKKVGTSISTGKTFDYDLTDLDSGTKYYFKAYAKNSYGTSYGSVKSFTSEGDSDKPSVKTKTPGEGDDYATLYGVVTDRGASDIESYGFYWGTNSSPGTKVEVGDEDIDEDKTFSYKLKNLNPGTTYYVKAYARNDDGTSFGEVLNFKIDEITELATLTTKVSDVSAGGATLTGTVTSSGGGTVSEYGFVWGEKGGAENRIKVGSSITVNTNYLYFLGGMQSGSSYYAKAYAVTGAGTAYGNKVEFIASGTSAGISPPSVAGAPVVVISNPAPNSSVVRGAALSIYASASDDAGVEAMGLYINGIQMIRPAGSALAYSLDTSALPSGTNTIRVTAWDGSNSGEQSIIINVQTGSPSSGTAPAVTISSPASGYQVYAGNMVEIAANSSPGVQAMGLYMDGSQKMRCGGTSFNYYLDTEGMKAGTYTIRVTAWDGSAVGEKTVSLIIL